MPKANQRRRGLSVHGPAGLDRLAERVAGTLTTAGITLATAESCTGGLIGGALTEVAGSSDWYLGGVITYSNVSKRDLIRVRGKTLKRFGAVSREVAVDMAAGVRERFGSDIAVSVTGIAGPGGAVPGKPVGRVWIGVTTPFGAGATEHTFQGDRATVRRAAVRAALLTVIAWASATAALESGKTS